jgi:copper chaperone CopZ
MTPGTTRTVLLVAGMRGQHCRDRLTHEIESVAGVLNVEVNLYRARATIFHGGQCGVTELLQAVVRSGCYASVTSTEGTGGAREDSGGDACDVAGGCRE